MRLRRLELFGFKSFADRTVFEFGTNSLTGVVGPNGCGKSNVVDSVRWVLGETRPTSMRGAEMTDVIFKGSASRPGLAVAEVTLILDNGANVLADRGAEVSITRRVFKSGEGEYLIDGQKVRLKDVREMLYDTGLGSRGYSVLEQGKIDAVLSANPLERRRIFEEAAGISRYRQRKVETELRLKRVAEDLARLDDVIGELASRVRSLKIQAGKAERWNEAKTEWSNERSRLLRHRLWQVDRDLSALREAIGALETQEHELRVERARAEDEVGSRERETGTLTAEIERLALEIGRMSGDGRALDERRAQLSGRVASWRSSATDESERAQKLATTLATRAAELATLSGDRGKLAARAETSQTESRTRKETLSALETSYRDQRAQAARLEEQVLALLSERTSLENRVVSLTQAQRSASEQSARVRERLDVARANSQAMRASEGQAGERVTQSQGALASHDERRKDLARRMQDLATQGTTLEREKNQLELERAKAQSRVEFLLARERDLEELSRGARRVLSEAEKAGAPGSSGSAGHSSVAAGDLVGLLADHLRTDTAHARALDAVLAARGSALVVKDGDAAQRIAAWLVANQAGQVGLLFAGSSDAKSDAQAARARTQLLKLEGAEAELVQGRLREHVRASEGCERLAELLLADVWLARDLDAALALAQRHPGLRFATPDGQLVDAAGVLAGTRELAQGAIGRRSSADELNVEIASLTQRVQTIEARRNEIAKERVALQKEWERSSQELETLRRALGEAQTELATSSARLRDLVAAERALENEIGAHEHEAERVAKELEQAQTRLESARSNYERENTRLVEIARARGTTEEERDALARESARADLEAAQAKAELDGLVRRLSDLERMQAETKAEHERAERLAKEHAENARAGAAEIEELGHKSAALLEGRAQLEQQVAELKQLADGGREAVDLTRARAAQVTRALEEHARELSDRRLERQRLELVRGEVLVRAQEELQLDELGLKTDFTPDESLASVEALEELETRVRELKGQLDKLGPVNLEAVAELSEVGGRLEFLQKQRADVEESRAQLDLAVQTIDGESKRLFTETFETVRGNFQRIFRQLFGGGRADVTLEENVDLLDAGVEIVARPPGRELLSIGLLSGGQRTLTALALLFAVFEARPSPFCMLDEVDAALDDANVERFLSMLGGYRGTTQFVVVTHNKATMTACDSLYGVTMETKGVSRQVSVELGDVDRWAGNAAADAPAVSVKPAAAPRRAVDAESGEPVVELIPKRADEAASAPAGEEAGEFRPAPEREPETAERAS